MNRTLAHRLNPMIGNDTTETLHNLTILLHGHCMLIADLVCPGPRGQRVKH